MGIPRSAAIVMVVLLALALGFIGGLTAAQTSVVPITGLEFPASAAAPTPAPGTLDRGLIDEAWELIQRNYADRQTLDETNLTYGAITGMVDALGDTGHSRFMSPEVVASENRQIKGEFEGIGAQLSVNEQGNPVILAPMDDSPAQRAGLRPEDIILKVDGFDASQASLSEVVQRVLGPAGTKVTLTIQRPATNEVFDVTITRARIVLRNVTWQMLPGTRVAHVRIAAFSDNVTRDLVNAINDARDQGAQGILLDLRNNPGGLLNEAVGVVSQFLDQGFVMQRKNAQGRVTNVPVERGGAAVDIPVVVLINQGSASASEITAGALQDYGRAKLVGETTFGTGTVLNQFALSDGSGLMLATELWLTPKGREIWHQGIAPDVEVKLAPEIAPSSPESERSLTVEQLNKLPDKQLTDGLKILQEQIRLAQP